MTGFPWRFLAAVMAVGLVGSALPAMACSFSFESWELPDPPLVLEGETPPALPDLMVESVTRGRIGDSSCDDLGFVRLSVPADAESITLYYQAEILETTIPLREFMSPSAETDRFPLTFWLKEDRLILFFIWLDGARVEQEPVAIRLRVTAFRRSGLKGESRDITITDPGRPAADATQPEAR